MFLNLFFKKRVAKMLPSSKPYGSFFMIEKFARNPDDFHVDCGS